MPKPKVKLEDFIAKLDTVSDVDWARLAAFIDGEGTITIASSPRRGRAAKSQHEGKVTVANTSILLMHWLVGTFGGAVRTTHYTGNLPMNFWVLNERQAEQVVIRCLPYFVIKGEQAEIFLSFRELKSRKAGVCANARVSLQMWNERESLLKRIRVLNGARTRFASESGPACQPKESTSGPYN